MRAASLVEHLGLSLPSSIFLMWLILLILHWMHFIYTGRKRSVHNLFHIFINLSSACAEKKASANFEFQLSQGFLSLTSISFRYMLLKAFNFKNVVPKLWLILISFQEIRRSFILRKTKCFTMFEIVKTCFKKALVREYSPLTDWIERAFGRYF